MNGIELEWKSFANQAIKKRKGKGQINFFIMTRRRKLKDSKSITQREEIRFK